MSGHVCEFKIASEDDAVELLQRLIDGFTFPENHRILFEAWPRFVIRIEGVDFDGTIPTRIMPTILELQKEVHRLYSLTVYGEESARRLSRADREKLELLVRVDKGSSFYDALLNGPVSKILQDATGRMNPEQITAVLIVAALSMTSVFMWKHWLAFRAKEKELEHTVELSRLEKEKMEVVERAKRQFPLSQSATSGIDDVRNGLLTKLKPEDRLEVNLWEERQPGPSPLTVSGSFAEQVVKKERETAKERVVEGDFLINTAAFSHADEFRVSLQRSEDGYVFGADIPHGVLAPSQTEKLKNNSWDRKPIFMRVLVKELHGRLTSAKVVSVGE
ncbi:MAG: hypothetical protein RQ754_16800 [Desulfuromonadales bacterium]|nr:hypothetical protein [Desulfuromonadales bacterium]